MTQYVQVVPIKLPNSSLDKQMIHLNSELRLLAIEDDLNRVISIDYSKKGYALVLMRLEVRVV